MPTIVKLTSKCQTTIPRQVREALRVGPGDSLLFDVDEHGKVELRRADPIDLEYLRAIEGTLSEWSSPEDDEAFRDL